MTFPVIALIGQKNVGKSTLFNRLTCTNDALIANYVGVTRDRQYGYLYCKLFKSILIDTGGIEKFYSTDVEEIQSYVYNQTMLAIKEADIILFVVDGRSKETVIDHNIIDFLRKLEKNIFIVINKIDDIKNNKNSVFCDGYYRFGIENIITISAMHGHGISYLLEKISHQIDKKDMLHEHIKNCVLTVNKNLISKKYRLRRLLPIFPDIFQKNFIVLAVVGRPNSGKSTFINTILGINRMITCSIPGTTRDSIYTSTLYNGQQYILIDTAGIRKKKRFNDNNIDFANKAEQVAISKTFQVIKDAHIILFMIDANVGVSEKDLSMLRCVMNIGISLIIVINKWDDISMVMRCVIKEMVYKKIDFIEFVQVHFISALYKSGFNSLFQAVQIIYKRLVSIHSVVNTSKLVRIMRMAIMKRPPPLFHGNIRIHPKYVHVGGYSPLTLVIHGAYVSKLSRDYQQYLRNYFYKNLNIGSVILHIRFKDSINVIHNNKSRCL